MGCWALGRGQGGYGRDSSSRSLRPAAGPGSLELAARPLEWLFIHAAPTALPRAPSSSHLAGNPYSSAASPLCPASVLPCCPGCCSAPTADGDHYRLQKLLPRGLSPGGASCWGSLLLAEPLPCFHFIRSLGICLQDLGHSLPCYPSIPQPGHTHSRSFLYTIPVLTEGQLSQTRPLGLRAAPIATESGL